MLHLYYCHDYCCCYLTWALEVDIADNANVDGVGQEEEEVEEVPREKGASMTCMADAAGWTSYYCCCCH